MGAALAKAGVGDEERRLEVDAALGHGRAPAGRRRGDGALVRINRTYGAARVAVGIALVAVQAGTGLLGARTSAVIVSICLAYAAQAIVLWLLPRFRSLALPQGLASRRRAQWLATIGVDLLAFGSLHVLEAGSSFNFAALLVLPVLMSGVLTPRLMALGTAAAVAMLLLGVAWWHSGSGGDGPVFIAQAGLAGMGAFVIALLAGEMATRLAREEIAAEGSLQLARQQAQLNRLVIEEMADGVLVVDRLLRVRAVNPAARSLLVAQGLAPAAPFELPALSAWAPLARAVEAAMARSEWPEAGQEITLAFEGGHSRTLRVRMRFTQRRSFAGTPNPLVVVLLEDVRTAQARLRQEKLAAMGRVSAGVAHEIRNPLASISQANALMLEGALDPMQAQLARMVAGNAERIRRIVDDVMEVAPGAMPEPQALDATALVASAVEEWRLAQPAGSTGPARLRVELPDHAVPVLFDPHHLHRVLVNLLDNAGRHGSDAPGAIFLRLAERDDDTAQLSVLSDGATIPPEIESHLFEPFFSTRSRGTGLGLYICRELCERYGASIEFRPRPAAERLRNEFHVVMRRAPARQPAPPSAAAAPGLAPR